VKVLIVQNYVVQTFVADKLEHEEKYCGRKSKIPT
jgi:hypothetical protein